MANPHALQYRNTVILEPFPGRIPKLICILIRWMTSLIRIGSLTFAKHRELKPKNAFKGSPDLPSGRGTIRSSSGSNTTLMASNWNVKGQRIKYSSTCSSHASVGRSNMQEWASA
ncbi:hypothetical protein FOIG_05495 [Fusarium odoratissimum NRRL 54006]|uniref:Uncharacterized protein n=2 Tax=Fusarium oxysporum species complex TaxID=171631 RepID=X0K566_FUSO5|nr:uncharacterized protein FOIG_05495 [Fusarium odoratissimum NRRL 54006]EXM03852.1 hypothetical protein FOIG_05495 [Fusarium odoratissimum NRRL 54006]TXC10550.1 hypothetical protein FocTR4_00005713 [Fusarium oxysporum f. sp. cubense]